MSAKEDKLFAEWGESLMEEVEAGEQEALKAWLALPVAREVFRGTLGQQEISRRMNAISLQAQELQKTREQLEAWYEEEAPKNEALIAERDALKAQLEELGSGGPPPAKDTGVKLSPEDLAEIKAKAQKVEVLDKLLPAVLGDVALMLQDATKNNFDFDPREAIKLSLQKGIEPYRAYLDLTADERQKRAEAAHEAERKKWFEEGRRAAMTNSPDHLQPSGPSVVDYLHSLNKAADQGGVAPKDRQDRVSDAIKELQNFTDLS